MNISHIIASMDESTGGPARSVTHLLEELGKIEAISQVNLLSLKSENPLLSKFSNPKLQLKFFEAELFGFSKALEMNLQSINTSLFHGQGLWQLPVHQMALAARKRKIPYVISIRGMLEPWSLQQSKVKKKIAMQLFQYKDLKEAACLHATALMEVDSIRKLGFKNPIACIPNGINIAEFPQKEYSEQPGSKKRVLFLSRIHPKKGIELLLEAWKSIDLELRENWIIEIAGNGENDYINQLKSLIKVKGLENKIKIVGPKFGKEKLALYQSADLFVLPTYSENFGIVIAEALSCGVPVITTKGTPWQELETVNAGKWIEIGVAPLKEALLQMMEKSDLERETMGKNGRKLIEEKYSIESVAKKMVALYAWIINGGKKPDFVAV
ncbi:MAG: glycosyltransferase [Lutibacter sp.]